MAGVSYLWLAEVLRNVNLQIWPVIPWLMTKAIYAFSGDPITNGHIDIIQRAAGAFDSLVVGIGVNPSKKYMFSLAEREGMARGCLARFPNVEVVSFEGMLVDYAFEQGIDVIVRGVRNSADFDFENTLHQAGVSQRLGIDTHLLLARPELAHVSSSLVKAIQKEQGLIREYVPLHVKQLLEARISGQCIVGVTGEMGSGKSYVSQKFVELGGARGVEVHNIELDHIGHQILGTLAEPAYSRVRSKIVEAFGDDVLQDGVISRKRLGDVVFNDSCALRQLNEIMETSMIVRLRREMYGKRGLVLVNAALIAESGLGYLCNNNCVIVHVSKDVQEERLKERGLNAEQIARRLGTQYDFKGKRSKLDEAVQQHNQGRVWVVENSGHDNIEEVFDSVIDEVKVC